MKRTPLYLAITGLTLTAGVAPAFGQEVEEIVVTGSLIPSSTQESRSTPVDVMTEIDLANQGSANVADIMRNQTFQFGFESVTNILAANGSGGTSGGANIRGLGETATLTLMDGRRSVTGNVRNIYPQILLQRLETVTDGAAAIYGTDAVAGIVNFIPRKSFEGVEVETSYSAAGGDGDYNERDISFIAGGAGDNSNFVMAMSYRKRSRLEFSDRPYYSKGSFSSSGEANPGTWNVGLRNELGVFIDPASLSNVDDNPSPTAFSSIRSRALAAASQPDPGCGLNNQGSGDKDEVGSISTGTVVFDTCRGEFGANFDYASPENVFNSAFLFTHDFSDSVSLETEFTYNTQHSESRGSPANPGGRTFLLPTVSGTHPGNPFRARASIDTNGDGEYGDTRTGGFERNIGAVLFAADTVNNLTGAAGADGIPDRDGSGQVILAADPFVQAAGDLAFYEDAQVNAWRVNYYSKKNGQPGPSNINSDGSVNGAGTFDVQGHRFASKLNYELGDSSWSGYSSYLYHRTVSDAPINTQSLSAISAGFQGLLAAGGSSAVYFNPFSTQYNICVDGDCDGQGVQTDPNQLNSAAVYDQITNYESTETTTTLQVVDSVATGELFDLPAGVVQAAVGAQWRFTEYEQDLGPKHNSGDALITALSPDFNVERDVYALFGEAQIPLFDSDTLGLAELSLAVRSERTDDDSTADLDSDTYKIAARWEINDMIVGRASFGTAFISPSLIRLFAPQTIGLSNVNDKLTGESGFKGRLLGGNPSLVAEEADVTNIGFTLSLLDGDLTWDFDYKIFEFENRIVRPLPQDLLTDDYNAFVASGQSVAAWVAGPNSDKRIVRAPVTNSIVVVNAESVNATGQTWKGFDTRLGYNLDTDFGRFSTVLAATYTDEYSFQSKPGSPVVNGAGRRNDETGFVPTLPRIRANLRLGWTSGVHSVGLTGRYTHHYLQDDSLCSSTLIANHAPTTSFFLSQIGVTNECELGKNVPSYQTWDIQYRADLDGLFGDTTTSITVGSNDMFDNEGVADRSLGGTEVNIVNPIGRTVYLRLRQSL